MQSVNQPFIDAILAPERQIRSKVDISLFDNDSISTSAVMSSTSNHTPPNYTLSPYIADNAFDGRSEIGRKVAVTAVDVFPANDVYPVPDDSLGGWWSNQISQTNGTLISREYLTIDYGVAKNVQFISVAGDSFLGYPVDFVVETSSNGTTWTNFTTVTGNTKIIWQYDHVTPVSARYVRLGVDKISKGSRYPVVLELSNGWIISSEGILADRIISIDLRREAFFEDSTSLPIGNYSASDCTIEIDNSDGAFYQNNKASPYYGYLTPNKKVKISLGLFTGINLDGSTVDPAADQTGTSKGFTFLPLGTFYTLGFQGDIGNSTVRISCWDRVKRLQEKEYIDSFVQINQTISQLLTTLATAAGLTASEYDIATTNDIINYSWFDKGPFWTHMSELAAGETGYIWVDENDRLVFKDRYFYWSTRIGTVPTSGGTTITTNYCSGVKPGDFIYIVDGTNTQQGATGTVGGIGTSSYDRYTVSSVDYPNCIITLSTAVRRAYPVDSYVTKSLPVVQLTGDNAITSASDTFALDKMKDKVVVKSNPLALKIDTVGNLVGSEVQWKTEDAFRLAPMGSTWTYTISAGGITTTTTVLDHKEVDVEFQSKPVIADGGGTPVYPVNVRFTAQELDSSGNPVGGLLDTPAYIVTHWHKHESTDIEGRPYAWGGNLEFHNQEGTGRRFSIIAVFVDGFGLETHSKQQQTAQDFDLTATYGEKTFELDNPFIVSAVQAQAIADNLLQQFKNPQSNPMRIELPLRGMFHLQLGDRISVVDPLSGYTDAFLNNHFYVVRMELTFDGTLNGNIECVVAN